MSIFMDRNCANCGLFLRAGTLCICGRESNPGAGEQNGAAPQEPVSASLWRRTAEADMGEHTERGSAQGASEADLSRRVAFPASSATSVKIPTANPAAAAPPNNEMEREMKRVYQAMLPDETQSASAVSAPPDVGEMDMLIRNVIDHTESLHQCRKCGTFWRLWRGQDGWSLADGKQAPGKCCDNSDEFLSLLVPDPRPTTYRRHK